MPQIWKANWSGLKWFEFTTRFIILFSLYFLLSCSCHIGYFIWDLEWFHCDPFCYYFLTPIQLHCLNSNTVQGKKNVKYDLECIADDFRVNPHCYSRGSWENWDPRVRKWLTISLRKEIDFLGEIQIEAFLSSPNINNAIPRLSG